MYVVLMNGLILKGTTIELSISGVLTLGKCVTIYTEYAKLMGVIIIICTFMLIHKLTTSLYIA